MSSDEEKIRVMMIFEAIGKPAEHIVEILEKVIGDLDEEKGVNILSKDIKKPTPIKDREDFFTTFGEVEVEVDDISNLSLIVFKYMPSNLEIIYPEVLVLQNNKLNDILNNLAIRLHGYDELARVMQFEKQILFKKIEELGGDIPKGVSPVAKIHQPGDEEKQKEKKPLKSKKKK